MSQKIVGFNAQPVRAAASFNYHGHCISFSNIMNNGAYCEVMVIDPDVKNTSHATVEDAIEFITYR